MFFRTELLKLLDDLLANGFLSPGRVAAIADNPIVLAFRIVTDTEHKLAALVMEMPFPLRNRVVFAQFLRQPHDFDPIMLQNSRTELMIRSDVFDNAIRHNRFPRELFPYESLAPEHAPEKG
jgi:hypothetical protein